MKRWGSLATLGLTLALCGCSDVGPGLKNHPLDCAIGIPWADCLPGTAGYNKGGGQQTRAQAASTEQAAIQSQFAATRSQCATELQSSDLDPIRDKVELLRDPVDAPVPFAIASNDTFPTEAERPVIARWAAIRDDCIRRWNSVSNIPPSASPLQVAYLQQSRSFGQEAAARVGSLVISLYQAKLTYGEFAQARYEVDRDAAAAERQFRSATLIADQQRQLQAQQLAQQQFQNTLLAWTAYTQAVSARQPQTVHVEVGGRLRTSCLSQRLGNFISTDCD